MIQTFKNYNGIEIKHNIVCFGPNSFLQRISRSTHNDEMAGTDKIVYLEIFVLRNLIK